MLLFYQPCDEFVSLKGNGNVFSPFGAEEEEFEASLERSLVSSQWEICDIRVQTQESCLHHTTIFKFGPLKNFATDVVWPKISFFCRLKKVQPSIISRNAFCRKDLLLRRSPFKDDDVGLTFYSHQGMAFHWESFYFRETNSLQVSLFVNAEICQRRCYGYEFLRISDSSAIWEFFVWKGKSVPDKTSPKISFEREIKSHEIWLDFSSKIYLDDVINCPKSRDLGGKFSRIFCPQQFIGPGVNTRLSPCHSSVCSRRGNQERKFRFLLHSNQGGWNSRFTF